MFRDGRGWYGESKRHALAAKGIKSGRKASQKGRFQRVDEGDRAMLREWMRKNIHPEMDVVWETCDEYGQPIAIGGGFLKLKFPTGKRSKKLGYLIKELFGVFRDTDPPTFTTKQSIARKLRQYEEDITDIRQEAEEL